MADAPLPIGEGQTISAPLVVARMCELLELSGGEHALDVGTGSGYHAALMSRLVRHIWSIENRPELSRQADANLRSAGIENVTLVVGDGSQGYPEAAPYDAINVAAAASGSLPAALEEQLASGGRLLAPVDGTDQRLVLARRTEEGIERPGARPGAVRSSRLSLVCTGEPARRPRLDRRRWQRGGLRHPHPYAAYLLATELDAFKGRGRHGALIAPSAASSPQRSPPCSRIRASPTVCSRHVDLTQPAKHLRRRWCSRACAR